MSLRYQGTFSAAERTMPVTAAVVVSPHAAGGWAVAERAMLPRGLAVDSARLDARSLVPRERITQQGPTRITLRFADDEARGTIDAGGQTRPIRAALCGRLVGDGAGAFLVIGRLPLAAGYHATIRHLDLQTAQTTLKQLVVLGIERVSVPAGRFDAWKVQVTEEGMVSPTTIWVDEASRVPVKFSASQGAVTIAMELAR